MPPSIAKRNPMLIVDILRSSEIFFQKKLFVKNTTVYGKCCKCCAWECLEVFRKPNTKVRGNSEGRANYGKKRNVFKKHEYRNENQRRCLSNFSGYFEKSANLLVEAGLVWRAFLSSLVLASRMLRTSLVSTEAEAAVVVSSFGCCR